MSKHPQGKTKLPLVPVIFLAIFILVNIALGTFSFMIFEDKNNPYGSYLIKHSILPEEKISKNRVVLLGNSVMHYSQVSKRLLGLRNKSLNPQSPEFFEVGNFGIVGSAIGDLLYSYLHIREYQPDMVVIQVISSSFTKGQGLFRTDLRRAHWMPSNLTHALSAPVRSVVPKEDWVDSIFYSLFPLYRFFPISRLYVKHHFANLTGLKIFEYFPWTANLEDEWQLNKRFGDKKGTQEKEWFHPSSMAVLSKLLDLAKSDGVQVYLIVTPHRVRQDFILSELEKTLKSHPEVRWDNFSTQYASEEFTDNIHPNAQGSQKIAESIFKNIQTALSSP